MVSRNVFFLAVIGCLLATVAVAQTPVKEANATGIVDITAPEGGAIVLYDQTDMASGNGAPDQDFEAGYDQYDSEASDDFDVTFPTGWTIEQINTIGTTGTPGAATVRVEMYEDNGGTPLGGAVVCSFPGITPTVDNLGSFQLDLPGGCALPSGLHWVAIQTSQNFAANGQHFWSNRTVDTNAPGHWRNPGDGFGSGCIDWQPAGTNCAVGGGFNDFLFNLVGTEGGEEEPPVPPTEIPTLGQFGILALLLSLLGAGIFRLRRRS